MAGFSLPVTSESTCLHITRRSLWLSEAGLQFQGDTCVKETPDDSVVGMQQKTASPKANSGGFRGSRRAATPASGVMSRMESMPKSTAPQDDRACTVSPLRRARPDITNIPVVVRFCSPAFAARTPAAGKQYLWDAQCD